MKINIFRSPFTQLIFILTFILCGCKENDDFINLEEQDFHENAIELKIRNYLGNYQNIHPKVLYFGEPWNGYSYWMAYTPYPNGVTSTENPCMAASNDGINWVTPKGLKNPLFNQFAGGYNSDTHLVYREDDGVLECWWRPHITEEKADLICRRTSKDGIHWSAPETVTQLGESRQLRLSPAVIIEDGNYIMFYSSGRYIFETHCPVAGQLFNWSPPRKLYIPQDKLSLWHLDVIQSDNKELEFAICAFEPGNNNNSADLYYVKGSMESGKFTEPVKIIERSKNEQSIDYQSIYRTSILKKDSKYYIYYSSIDKNFRRHLSLIIKDALL